MKSLPKSPILLIVNPSAGHQYLKRKWDSEVHPFLIKELCHFDYEFTTRKGHATELTKNALKKGYKMIVSMGGDGTLNEVINGFFEDKKPINRQAILGILPFGSGGDFIRTLCFERTYKKAIHRIRDGSTKWIDVGLVEFENKKYNMRYFINTVQIGMGAIIMKKVNAKNRNLPSLARYLIGTFQGFFDYHNTKIQLVMDAKKPKTINLTNLIVANGRYFGRGMQPAPQAELDDGLLDIIILKNLTLPRMIFSFPQMYLKTKHLASHNMETHTIKNLTLTLVDSHQTIHTETDGENHGEGNLKISILPQSIRLLV